jgi:hypothetical protein
MTKGNPYLAIADVNLLEIFFEHKGMVPTARNHRTGMAIAKLKTDPQSKPSTPEWKKMTNNSPRAMAIMLFQTVKALYKVIWRFALKNSVSTRKLEVKMNKGTPIHINEYNCEEICDLKIRRRLARTQVRSAIERRPILKTVE